MPLMPSCAFERMERMRDALNRVAMCVDTIVVGIVLAHLLRSSALVYVSIGLALTGMSSWGMRSAT